MPRLTTSPYDMLVMEFDIPLARVTKRSNVSISLWDRFTVDGHMTIEMADELSCWTGASTEFWMNVHMQYTSACNNLSSTQTL